MIDTGISSSPGRVREGATPEPPADREQRAAQAERRRERILDTVLDLARKGGYDAVQLRDVADLADVSTRTIYKYFGSRDNMLIAALARWRSGVAERSVAAMKGDSIEERLLSLWHHNFSAFASEPKMFETFMRVHLETRLESFDWGQQALKRAADAELVALDDAARQDFHTIVGSVIFTSFAVCSRGMLSFDEVWSLVERVLRHVLMTLPAALEPPPLAERKLVALWTNPPKAV